MMVAPELQIAIEQFLFQEAGFLEANQFADWLALFSDDAHYFMPVRETVEAAAGAPPQPPTAFALFDDDRSSLALRIRRIETGLAHAEVPHSVTQRLVTNVRIVPAANGEFDVRSNFMVFLSRRGRNEHMFVGSRDDRLRRTGDGFKIARRTVNLAQTLLPSTISIFM